MKSIVIYYSYTGNTKKVAAVLAGYLKEKSEVEIIELKSLDEARSFLGQAARAFWKKRAQIQPVNFDLKDFDLICLGTPVWAFAPAPAMNTYLDNCAGLEGKDIILFTTYGSGTGNKRCLNYMQEILSQKGAREFKKFSIQQFKVNDQNFILYRIKEVLSL
jgi:flavodoxin